VPAGSFDQNANYADIIKSNLAAAFAVVADSFTQGIRRQKKRGDLPLLDGTFALAWGRQHTLLDPRQNAEEPLM
jgi:hypothetical protein